VAGCATPTGSAGHAGATANLKLTFQLDHSAGLINFGKRSGNSDREGLDERGLVDSSVDHEIVEERVFLIGHDSIGPRLWGMLD
jgi:hypothetical protein